MAAGPKSPVFHDVIPPCQAMVYNWHSILLPHLMELLPILTNRLRRKGSKVASAVWSPKAILLESSCWEDSIILCIERAEFPGVFLWYSGHSHMTFQSTHPKNQMCNRRDCQVLLCSQSLLLSLQLRLSVLWKLLTFVNVSFQFSCALFGIIYTLIVNCKDIITVKTK